MKITMDALDAQPLLPRPQTVRLQPPPEFTPCYVNVRATFTVPQLTASDKLIIIRDIIVSE